MSRQKNAENLSPVTGSVPAALREAIEEHRWSARKTVSEVVREALELWADSKGLVYAEGGENGTENGATQADEKSAAGKPGAKVPAKS